MKNLNLQEFRKSNKEQSLTDDEDHLCVALDQKGVVVFRDDQELERVKVISPGLLTVIEE